MATSPFSSGGSSRGIWSVIIIVTYIHGEFPSTGFLQKKHQFYKGLQNTKVTYNNKSVTSVYRHEASWKSNYSNHRVLYYCVSPRRGKAKAGRQTELGDHGLESPSSHVNITSHALTLSFSSKFFKYIDNSNYPTPESFWDKIRKIWRQ